MGKKTVIEISFCFRKGPIYVYFNIQLAKNISKYGLIPLNLKVNYLSSNSKALVILKLVKKNVLSFTPVMLLLRILKK